MRFAGIDSQRGSGALAAVAALTVIAHFAVPTAFGLTRLAMSDDKGASYARIRLVGAILLEQNDEWSVQRARYITLETIIAVSDDPLVSVSSTTA